MLTPSSLEVDVPCCESRSLPGGEGQLCSLHGRVRRREQEQELELEQKQRADGGFAEGLRG